MQRRRRQQNGTIVAISGRWFVRYYRDVNENGVVVRKKVSACLGEIEGRASKNPPQQIKDAAAAHIREKVGWKVISERSGLSLEQFIEQVYLPLIDETRRPATSGQSRFIWQRRLKPQHLQIGSKRVRAASLLIEDAETYHVQAWLDAVAADSEQVLSKSVLKQCKFLLSGAFRLALQRGYRTTAKGHPVENCSLPARTAPAKETYAYSPDDIRAFASVLQEPALTVVLFAAETGLRQAELRGVRWEDLDGDTLMVSRSVWKNHVSAPKTAASMAPVHISRQLRERLEMRRALDGFPETGPIFRTSLGTPLSLDNVRLRMIVPALKRCAVCSKAEKDHAAVAHDFKLDDKFPKWHGWHAFRRGLATDLEAQPIKVAQGALRHADAATTQRYYQKTVAADVRSAIEERSGKLEISLLDTSRQQTESSGSERRTVN